MKYFLTIVLMVYILSSSGCHNSYDNNLILTKYLLSKNDKVAFFGKIGDIEIWNLEESGFLDDFENQVVFVKRKPRLLIYKVNKTQAEWFRTSKEYIALVKPYIQSNTGWFWIHNGKLSNDLPNIKHIVDSLKNTFKHNFLRESSGYIRIYNKGKELKTINYGNCVAGFSNTKFDDLSYGLYSLTTRALKKISNDGNDLIKQADGLYFVPSPGYNIIRKYNKDDVIENINIASKMSVPYKKIVIKSTR